MSYQMPAVRTSSISASGRQPKPDPVPNAPREIRYELTNLEWMLMEWIAKKLPIATEKAAFDLIDDVLYDGMGGILDNELYVFEKVTLPLAITAVINEPFPPVGCKTLEALIGHMFDNYLREKRFMSPNPIVRRQFIRKIVRVGSSYGLLRMRIKLLLFKRRFDRLIRGSTNSRHCVDCY